MHYARFKSLPDTIYLIHERGNRIENALRCLNSGKESYGTYCGRGGRLKTVALECMLNAIPSTGGGKPIVKHIEAARYMGTGCTCAFLFAQIDRFHNLGIRGIAY